MRGVWVLDPETGELLPAPEYAARKRERECRNRTGNPVMMTDSYASGFRSPVDGSMLYSRQDVREHNARNDVVSVGNDYGESAPKPGWAKPMESSESFIRDLYNTESVENVPDDA